MNRRVEARLPHNNEAPPPNKVSGRALDPPDHYCPVCWQPALSNPIEAAKIRCDWVVTHFERELAVFQELASRDGDSNGFCAGNDARASRGFSPVRATLRRGRAREGISPVTTNGWPWPSLELTYRESLRDVEAALAARTDLLYQMGFRSLVRRSTLADANEQRDWRIYADWAERLIRRSPGTLR